ncbi:MAG: ATP-binding protein [Luteibaculum sp.]
MSDHLSKGTYKEENYGRIFNEIEEMALIGGWMLDVATGKTEWTSQVYKIHDLDESVTTDLEKGVNYYTPASRVLVSKAVGDCINFHQPFKLKLQLKSAKGQLKDVQVAGKPELEDGDVVRVWGAIQDITETEERLRKLEDDQIKLKTAQSVSNFGFYETNLLTSTWTGSDRFYEIFGFDKSKEPFTTLEFQAIVHPDDYEEVMRVFGQALQNKEDFNAEYRCIQQKTGETIWVRSTSKVEYNSEGTPLRILGVKSDITSYKNLLLAQESTNMELQEKNTQLEQYAFLTSHDLKSPLNNLQGFLELIAAELEEIDNEEIQEYMDYVFQTTSRMKKQISTLLDHAKIGVRRNVGRCDLSKIVNKAVSDLGTMIDDTHAKIKINHLPVVKGDEVELKILFQNLLENAIKYRKPDSKPEITIAAGDRNKDWLISIADNGMGIPKESQEEIFKMFARTEEAKDVKGTGIGLYHCRKIVELHAGKIWVDENQQGGSTFYFNLPNFVPDL